MKDTLVNYEIAKLAKDLGFYIKDSRRFIINNFEGEKLFGICSGQEQKDVDKKYFNDSKLLLYPTQSLLQRWLREIHTIHIEIEIAADEELINIIPFVFQISVYKEKEGYFPREFYDTYEEALEKGLEMGLKMIKK